MVRSGVSSSVFERQLFSNGRMHDHLTIEIRLKKRIVIYKLKRRATSTSPNARYTNDCVIKQYLQTPFRFNRARRGGDSPHGFLPIAKSESCV